MFLLFFTKTNTAFENFCEKCSSTKGLSQLAETFCMGFVKGTCISPFKLITQSFQQPKTSRVVSENFNKEHLLHCLDLAKLG